MYILALIRASPQCSPSCSSSPLLFSPPTVFSAALGAPAPPPPTMLLHPVLPLALRSRSIQLLRHRSLRMARSKKLMTRVHRALRHLNRTCGARVKRRSWRLTTEARVRYYAPSRYEDAIDTVVQASRYALDFVYCEFDSLKFVLTYQFQQVYEVYFQQVHEVYINATVRVAAIVEACEVLDLDDVLTEHEIVPGLKATLNRILREASANLTTLAQNLAADLKAEGFRFV